jgi:hypothetical protein
MPSVAVRIRVIGNEDPPFPAERLRVLHSWPTAPGLAVSPPETGTAVDGRMDATTRIALL